MSRNLAVYGVVAFFALVIALVILVLIGGGPSRPADTVSYSDDGETWSATLPGPLFDKDISWVPGDRRDAGFHVSNDTDNDGRVVLLIESTNPVFADALTLSVGGKDLDRSCAQIDVPAQSKTRVNATLVMDVGAGNETQRATAGIDIVVRWDNQDDDLCVIAQAQGAEDVQQVAQP